MWHRFKICNYLIYGNLIPILFPQFSCNFFYSTDIHLVPILCHSLVGARDKAKKILADR